MSSFIFTLDICEFVNNWSIFLLPSIVPAVSIMLDLKEDYNQDKSQSELPFGGPL